MDRTLVVRAQNGDRGAFEALATTLYGRLHRLAYDSTLEADDDREGTWQGSWTGIGSTLDSWRAYVELTGSGACEGLSATLFTQSGETGPVAGMIFPTDLDSCQFAPLP